MANGGFVHVACRLPQGIRLRLFEWVDGWEPGPQGPRAIKVSRPVMRDGRLWEFIVPGFNPGLGKVPANYIVVPQFKTVRVPKDFWDEYVKQNHDSALLENKILFAASTEPDLTSMIKEAESGNVRSGLEPLVTSNDPRVARGVFAVTTADEMPR